MNRNSGNATENKRQKSSSWMWANDGGGHSGELYDGPDIILTLDSEPVNYATRQRLLLQSNNDERINDVTDFSDDSAADSVLTSSLSRSRNHADAALHRLQHVQLSRCAAT
jgi:hypothetical protein